VIGSDAAGKDDDNTIPRARAEANRLGQDVIGIEAILLALLGGNLFKASEPAR
jgi:hypothetical protein